jgi:hypothetical protein
MTRYWWPAIPSGLYGEKKSLDELARTAKQSLQLEEKVRKAMGRPSSPGARYSGNAQQNGENDRSSIVTTDAEKNTEGIYEGTINLIVQWPGSVRPVY